MCRLVMQLNIEKISVFRADGVTPPKAENRTFLDPVGATWSYNLAGLVCRISGAVKTAVGSNENLDVFTPTSNQNLRVLLRMFRIRRIKTGRIEPIGTQNEKGDEQWWTASRDRYFG